MSFTNYGRGSRVSRRYWLETTREKMARGLISCGHGLAWLAELIAPWLKPEPEQPRVRTTIRDEYQGGNHGTQAQAEGRSAKDRP